MIRDAQFGPHVVPEPPGNAVDIEDVFNTGEKAAMTAEAIAPDLDTLSDRQQQKVQCQSCGWVGYRLPSDRDKRCPKCAGRVQFEGQKAMTADTDALDALIKELRERNRRSFNRMAYDSDDKFETALKTGPYARAADALTAERAAREEAERQASDAKGELDEWLSRSEALTAAELAKALAAQEDGERINRRLNDSLDAVAAERDAARAALLKDLAPTAE